jgi:hypothetical protein
VRRRHLANLGFPIWLPLLLGVILFLAANVVSGQRRARAQRRVVRHTIEQISGPIVWKLV